MAVGEDGGAGTGLSGPQEAPGSARPIRDGRTLPGPNNGRTRPYPLAHARRGPTLVDREHPVGQEAPITAGVRGFDPEALVRARKARGLSQEALGEAVGRARTNIIPWEKVAGDTPSPRNLVLLAEVLDVHPWELTNVNPEEAELADLRTWAGLTQRELADAAQIARSSYSLLERGGLPLHAEVAERIAAELGRTVEEVERAYMRSKAGTGSSQRLEETRRDL